MEERIVICNECKGTGKKTITYCTNYHHGYYENWDEPCKSCDGAGRMVEQITIRKLTKKELKINERECIKVFVKE